MCRFLRITAPGKSTSINHRHITMSSSADCSAQIIIANHSRVAALQLHLAHYVHFIINHRHVSSSRNNIIACYIRRQITTLQYKRITHSVRQHQSSSLSSSHHQSVSLIASLSFGMRSCLLAQSSAIYKSWLEWLERVRWPQLWIVLGLGTCRWPA